MKPTAEQLAVPARAMGIPVAELAAIVERAKAIPRAV